MTKEDIIKLIESRIEVYRDLEDECREYGLDISVNEARAVRGELEEILKEIRQ